MSSIDKKLFILNKALELSLGVNNFEKISSLKRSVDITSYARKVMGLFFPYLAKKLTELSDGLDGALEEYAKKIEKEKVEKEEEAVRLGSPWGLTSFSDMQSFEKNNNIPKKTLDKILELEDEYHNLGDKVYDYKDNIFKNKILKIYIKPKKRQKKIEVYFKDFKKNSQRELINTADLSIFSDEEKKIILNSGHAFNIHLRNTRGGDDPIQGGGVAGRRVESGEFIVYNPKIFYSTDYPDVLKKNINKLYNEILDLITHESTHQQQFMLEDTIYDYYFDNPELGKMEERYNPVTSDRGYINIKNVENKNKWIKSKFKLSENEEEEEEEEDLTNYIPSSTQPVTIDNSQKDVVIRMLLSRFSNCPETLAEFKKELEENKNQKPYEIYVKYMDDCSEERKSIGAENILENYHKKIIEEKDNELKSYYISPIEIEAYIRGFRSNLKSSKENLATEFCKEITSRFSDVETAKEIWEAWKKMYKKLNYPEKDLGDDSIALGCIKSTNKTTRKDYLKMMLKNI